MGSQATRPKHGGLCQMAEVKREALERIHTVRGHVAAIEGMIGEERYCIDILRQIAAVQASLSQVARTLTKCHMRCCVKDAIEAGHGDEKIDELMEVFKYLKAF